MPSSPLPPGTPVVAYLRDSGGDAQELSLPQQEAAIRAYCERHGLALTRIFRDEARPGSSTVGRDGFLAMIRYFRSGQAPEKALIIWKYSRFARDIDDAQFYRADLRRRGIAILSLNDNIPDGPAGRFFEAALDWMNQQFLEDLSTDVKRGLRHLVHTFGCVPGTPPLGFKRTPVHIGKRRDGSLHTCHRWTPDPDLAPLIRQAFEMRAAGIPISQIHRQLRLYRGLNSYTTFFRNKLYIGILEYGGELIENYCDPIVDPQTWHTVQRLMDDHAARFGRRHPRRVASPFLLSGLAHCARCGAPLYGHIVTRPGKGRDEAYRCTRAKRNAGCDAPRIPRLALETAVLQTLAEAILAPANLTAIYQQTQAALRQHQQQRLDELQNLRRQKSNLSRRITNLARAISDAGPLPALLDELKHLEAQRTAIETQIHRLEHPLPDIPDLTPDQIAQHSAELIDRIRRAPLDERKALLQSLIARIYAERDGKTLRGHIEYHIPPPFLHPLGSPNASSSPGLPIHFSPVGAQLHRQPFTHPIKKARP